jgi:hypothetical protein
VPPAGDRLSDVDLRERATLPDMNVRGDMIVHEDQESKPALPVDRRHGAE